MKASTSDSTLSTPTHSTSDTFGADLRSFQESADRKIDRLLYLIMGSWLTIMLAIFFLK